MTTNTIDSDIETLKEYLLSQGVLPYAADLALQWIQSAAEFNGYLARNLRSPRVRVNNKFKTVDVLTVRCTFCSIIDRSEGIIRYDHRGGHKLTIKMM